jgi:hypothetical protein
VCKTTFIDDVTVNMTSQRCTRRSLPNYLVMTSYHWNVRQNILTWRWWMNDKITWRHARNVPTLFLRLFHWMSINLGSLFFICFSTFCQLNVFFQIRVSGLKFNKRLFSSTVNISFAKDGYLWPKVTWPQRRPRNFPIMHHYTS